MQSASVTQLDAQAHTDFWTILIHTDLVAWVWHSALLLHCWGWLGPWSQAPALGSRLGQSRIFDR